MPLVPAKCENCGLIFPASGGILVGNGVQVSLSGNKYQPCPRCGGTADFLEGTFKVGADLFEVIQAPETSVEMLRHLRLMLIEAQVAADAPEAIVNKVEQISPGIANSLRGLINDPDRFFQLVLALIGLLAAAISSDGKIEIKVDAFNTFMNCAPPSLAQHRDQMSEGQRGECPDSPEDRPKK